MVADWRDTLANLGNKNKVNSKLDLDSDLKAQLKGLVSSEQSHSSAPSQPKKQQKFFAPSTPKTSSVNYSSTSNSSKQAKAKSLGSDLSALESLRQDLAVQEKAQTAPLKAGGFGYKLGSKKKEKVATTSVGSFQLDTNRQANKQQLRDLLNSDPKVKTSSKHQQQVTQDTSSQAQTSLTRAFNSNEAQASSQSSIHPTSNQSPSSSNEKQQPVARGGLSSPRSAASSRAMSTAPNADLHWQDTDEDSAVLRQLDRLARERNKRKSQEQALQAARLAAAAKQSDYDSFFSSQPLTNGTAFNSDFFLDEQNFVSANTVNLGYQEHNQANAKNNSQTYLQTNNNANEQNSSTENQQVNKASDQESNKFLTQHSRKDKSKLSTQNHAQATAKNEKSLKFILQQKELQAVLDTLIANSPLTLVQKHQLKREIAKVQQQAQLQVSAEQVQQLIAALEVTKVADLLAAYQGQELTLTHQLSLNQRIEKLALTIVVQAQAQEANHAASTTKQATLIAKVLTKLVLLTLAAFASYALRQAAVPSPITYTPDLPVTQQIDLIRKLLRFNQVIVVAGDTGSGKTTQLPKLCLEMGYSTTGMIGHTQPRRIAASSVANRIAQELESELGNLVGYKVRFNEQVSPQTHIKLMTDGILLAEMQHDPLLRQYSCLIIDEAHERSLNNDFILGYLKLILPQRPDLKVIITSATIDLQRFSQHFNNCPIIEVAGRTFPVEVRYRPLTLDNFVSDESAMDENELATFYSQNPSCSYGETNARLAHAFAAAVQASENKALQEVTARIQAQHEQASQELAPQKLEKFEQLEQLLQAKLQTQFGSAQQQSLTSSKQQELINTPISNNDTDFAAYVMGEEEKEQEKSSQCKSNNLKAGETFGLSQVNPYAEQVQANSSFARRIYTSPQKQNPLASNNSLQAVAITNIETPTRAVTNTSSVPALAKATLNSSLEQSTATVHPNSQTSNLQAVSATNLDSVKYEQAAVAAAAYLARRKSRQKEATAVSQMLTQAANSPQIIDDSVQSTEQEQGTNASVNKQETPAFLSAEQASQASNYHLLTNQDLHRIASRDFSQAKVYAAQDSQEEIASSRYGTTAKDKAAFHAYRKYADSDDAPLDLYQGVIAATEELLQEERGDILVFLSGEREIRDVANELTQHFTYVNRRYPSLRILPLYSRLSSAEQQLIFKPDGHLRIILATNIAETSLTVPGIKYVIDAGTARISRYNYKTQVQGLPIEPISQASANQRKGRCGRTSPGICIRLYSEEDFNSRPQFTDPEIRRTNLSAVILKMLSLNLPHIEDFPFLDAPDTSFIRNGLKLLEQLQAIHATPQGYAINKLGRQLAELPVDPRLGRMILEASNLGSLNEMLILAAGLTIVDVRETPQGKLAQAQQMHSEYKDKNSDFVTLLNLWEFLFKEKLSNTQFRKLCKKRYLNYLRVREWQDLYQQLKQVAVQLKLRFNNVPATYPELHRAMIPGLLDHIAQIDSNDRMQYKGARGKVFRFFNTSVLYRQRQTWVMVTEMIHLTKTYAMRGAVIEPSWIEPYAKHLLKYSYQQPHWSKKRGEVCAYMSANLFGLTVVDKRLVSYGNIDPQASHELFIRQALVEQNWEEDYDFYLHNNTVLAQALKVEEQQRKRGLIISEEDLYQWYHKRIPNWINNNVSFNKWWQKMLRTDPHYLDIDYEHILNPEQELASFPEYIQDGNYKLKLNYQFELESPWDGVNVLVPIQFLQTLDYRLYQWHIANYRAELVEALIRNLPKSLRRQLIPAPDYAQVFVERIPEVLQEKGKTLSFYTALTHTFRQVNGTYIEPQLWQEAADQLPAHLIVHFTVLDLEGQVMAQGNDLLQLQQDLQHTSQELVNSKSKQDLAKAKIYTDFTFNEFGQMRQLKKNGVLLDSYPALVPVLSLSSDKQKALAKQLQVVHSDAANKDLTDFNIASGVIIQNLATADEQARVMRAGMLDLLLLNSRSPIKFLQEKLPNRSKLAMHFSGDVRRIIAECIRAAADAIMTEYEPQARKLKPTQDELVWDKDYYDFLLDKMRGNINDTTYKVVTIVEDILVLAYQINKALKKQKDLEVMLAVNDMQQQVASLTRENFVAEHTLEQLAQVPRYLEAMLYRIERMGQNPNLDQQRQAEVNTWEEVYNQLKATWPVYRDPIPLTELFFMLQEFRVSLFAQSLGSRIPISAKRIEQYVEQIKDYTI